MVKFWQWPTKKASWPNRRNRNVTLNITKIISGWSGWPLKCLHVTPRLLERWMKIVYYTKDFVIICYIYRGSKYTWLFLTCPGKRCLKGSFQITEVVQLILAKYFFSLVEVNFELVHAFKMQYPTKAVKLLFAPWDWVASFCQQLLVSYQNSIPLQWLSKNTIN